MKWGVIVSLFLLFGIQLGGRFLKQSPQFETMPIFTPTSLQYEKEFRGGEKPLNIAQMMEILPRLEREAKNSKLPPEQLEAFRAHRSRMLELRNQRHELNVQMMNSAIEILSVLTAEQWEFVQSNRDSIQSKIELDILERLLQK